MSNTIVNQSCYQYYNNEHVHIIHYTYLLPYACITSTVYKKLDWVNGIIKKIIAIVSDSEPENKECNVFLIYTLRVQIKLV